MVIGMAAACRNMTELKYRMARAVREAAYPGNAVY
jgi:hypothetical protein